MSLSNFCCVILIHAYVYERVKCCGVSEEKIRSCSLTLDNRIWYLIGSIKNRKNVLIRVVRVYTHDSISEMIFFS